MSRPKLIPDDVRQICIHLVRGYERRVREYYDKRREIIEGSSARFEVIKDKDNPEDWKKAAYFFPPSSHSASRTGEDKAVQLMNLEADPDTQRMRAVEEARATIGLDLPEAMRNKLAAAIMLNCKAGKKYRYEILDVDGIGRTDFYARRTRFLIEIAKRLDLM